MVDATYRFELAKQGRAGCQNTACKKAEIKIQKGEFRMGTLVVFDGNPSWRWKHWGCVTPLQIENLQDQVGTLEDLDLDDDLPTIIDGYEDLDVASQEKIKFALENGHVPDEDWKGEPELNRPGMKGINKRTPKKKPVENEEDAGTENGETPSKPPAKKGRGKKAKAEPESDDDLPAPKKKAAAKRKTKVEDDDAEHPPPPKRKRARKAPVKDEEEDEEPTEQPVKKSRTKKVKAEDDDEVVAAPAKRSRAKKVKAEEPEDEEMPDAPQAEPVKRGKARKRSAVKAEVDDDEVKPLIAQEDDEPLASKPSTKTARGKKAKANPAPEPEPMEETDVKAEEGVAEGDEGPTPARGSASAITNTNTDTGPALEDAELHPSVEESDVGGRKAEADQEDVEDKVTKAGKPKRARKPAKRRA